MGLGSIFLSYGRSYSDIFSFVSYLGFDHTATLFHIRDSPVDPLDRPIFLTNAFSFSIRIHDVSLPDEATTMFTVESRRRNYCEWDAMFLWRRNDFSWFCSRCRTSAHPSLFPHMSPVTSSLSSSGLFDPPFTLTATSCSSQMHQSFTFLSERTRASWRYTLLTFVTENLGKIVISRLLVANMVI